MRQSPRKGVDPERRIQTIKERRETPLPCLDGKSAAGNNRAADSPSGMKMSGKVDSDCPYGSSDCKSAA